MPRHTPPPRRSTVAVAAVLAAGATALLTAAGVTALTGQHGETRVALSDQIAGRPLFTVTGLAPGQTVERCWQITGHDRPQIRLWATSQGELAPHLRVKITSGRSDADPSTGRCDGYTPTATIGDSTLAALPSTPGTGLLDPDVYAAGERRTYRLQVTVAGDAPQSRRATASFMACAQAPGKTACDPVAADGAAGSSTPGSPGGGAGRCVRPTLADGVAKQIRKGKRIRRRHGAGTAQMSMKVTGPYGRRTIAVGVQTRGLRARRVVFTANKRRLKTDTQRPYTAVVPNHRLKVGRNQIRARVVLASGRAVSLRWGFRLAKPSPSACR